MLHRYSDMAFIMELEIEDFLGLIAKAATERGKEKAWDMWVSLYPSMMVPQPFEKEPRMKFIPFSEFYSLQTQKVTHRPADEILKEAGEIRKKLGKKA